MASPSNRRPISSRLNAPAWVALFAAMTACGHHDATDAALSDAAQSDAHAADAHVADAPVDAPLVDAGPAVRNFTPPTQIVALGTWVPVRRSPVRTAQLAGYLRAGAITQIVGMPHGTETCPVLPRFRTIGGWYELAGGGFVCVGNKLAVPYPSRDLRPAQPALDAGMPYQYASVTSNTIMYREPPTEEQLRVYERWRFRHDAGPTVAPAVMTPTVATPAPGSTPDPAASAHAAPAAEPSGTVTAEPTEPVAAPTAHEPEAPREHNHDHDRDREADRDDEHHHHRRRGNDDDENPPLPDLGATPTGEIRLRDLSGARGGPVIRRLLAGMFVALDRSLRIRETHDRYWHTQSGGWVRTSGLDPMTYRATFGGVRIDADHNLPFAFMLNHSGWVYRLTPNNRGAIADHRVDFRSGVFLTPDPPLHIGSGNYYRTVDGFAVSANSVRLVPLRPPPDGVTADEHWIDIDLDTQTLAAYEGTRAVFVTLVSTGRGPEPQMLTPEGHFRIRGKHITTTMDGDVLGRGPYSIEDVPWTMYFHDTIALHGAFWHQNFGYRMSHGCVNLSPPDAQWLFFWTEPELPSGWHGIFAAEDRPGTRIEVHHGDQPVVQDRLRP